MITISGWLLPESEISPSTDDRFAHILSAIGTVEQELHEVSEEMLANDRIRRMALERCFEIISIASYHIPSSLKAAGDGVDWQAIADIGDRLENTRDRVEAVLCTTWRDKVMPLKACAKRHLAELR